MQKKGSLNETNLRLDERTSLRIHWKNNHKGSSSLMEDLKWDKRSHHRKSRFGFYIRKSQDSKRKKMSCKD